MPNTLDGVGVTRPYQLVSILAGLLLVVVALSGCAGVATVESAEGRQGAAAFENHQGEYADAVASILVQSADPRGRTLKLQARYRDLSADGTVDYLIDGNHHFLLFYQRAADPDHGLYYVYSVDGATPGEGLIGGDGQSSPIDQHWWRVVMQ